MTNPDSEAALESAALDLFARLKWQTANCYDETFGLKGRDVPVECLRAGDAPPGRLYLGRVTTAASE